MYPSAAATGSDSPVHTQRDLIVSIFHHQDRGPALMRRRPPQVIRPEARQASGGKGEGGRGNGGEVSLVLFTYRPQDPAGRPPGPKPEGRSREALVRLRSTPLVRLRPSNRASQGP